MTPSPSPALSAIEWQTRVNLAACYRLVSHYGMTDLVYNHITARIPGTDTGNGDHLLISKRPTNTILAAS